MRRTGLSLVLALSLTRPSVAHRLDEYLQATLIGVTRGGVDVEINLTPGVAVLPVVMAVIDQDRDGRISPEEERVYAARVAREVSLQIDGAPAPLSLIESNFPSMEAMQQGLGTIRMKLHAARTGHALRFENRHLPQVSVYLVNCLASPSDGLVVKQQTRDQSQRSIEFAYAFPRDTVSPIWAVAVGMLVLVAIYRARRSVPSTRRRAPASIESPSAPSLPHST